MPVWCKEVLKYLYSNYTAVFVLFYIAVYLYPTDILVAVLKLKFLSCIHVFKYCLISLNTNSYISPRSEHFVYIHQSFYCAFYEKTQISIISVAFIFMGSKYS